MCSEVGVRASMHTAALRQAEAVSCLPPRKPLVEATQPLGCGAGSKLLLMPPLLPAGGRQGRAHGVPDDGQPDCEGAVPGVHQ